jgi:hypothetical protein
LNAFYEAITMMNRPQIWVPLLVYLGFKLSLIFLYRATFLGPLGALWATLLPADVRPALVHYPWDLIYMPLVLGRLNIGLDIVASVVFQGATVVLFANAMRDQPLSLSGAFRATLGRYRVIVAVTFVATVVLLGVVQLPALVEKITPLASRPKLVGLFDTAAAIFVQVAFLYTLPLVLLTGYSFRGAIAGSIQWAKHSPAQSVLLVLIPFMLTVPTLLLGLQSSMLVSRLAPETMVAIEVATEIAAWISTLLLTGGLTIWFVRRKGRELVV